MKNVSIVLTGLVILISIHPSAQLSHGNKDDNNYSLISRFSGAVIEWYQAKTFGPGW